MMKTAKMFYFSDELQKLAGISAAQPQPQQPKKKNAITRNVGLGTLAAGGLTAALALKNPASAAKYLGQAKQMVTNPKAALQRGFRSGASNTRAGTAGASEAASKRVGMYKQSLEGALGYSPQAEAQALAAGKEFTRGTGKQVSYQALDKPTSLRASGWGSVGKATSKGELTMSKELQEKAHNTLLALQKGERVPEAQIKELYTQIQGVGGKQGLEMKKSLGRFLPGERGAMLAMGAGGGAMGGMETHDPETGRKRGVAERLARGTVGAATGAMVTPLFMGRGAGLSKKNLFTGKLPQGTLSGYMTQKALMPLAGSTVAMGGGLVATDVAGGGGALVDKAFGQK